jgi:uncharacterized protein
MGFWQTLLLGFGLALVIEGLVPFVSPTGWRQTMQRIQQLNDGQVRYFGMVSIGVGAAIVFLVAAFAA